MSCSQHDDLVVMRRALGLSILFDGFVNTWTKKIQSIPKDEASKVQVGIAADGAVRAMCCVDKPFESISNL